MRHYEPIRWQYVLSEKTFKYVPHCFSTTSLLYVVTEYLILMNPSLKFFFFIVIMDLELSIYPLFNL